MGSTVRITLVKLLEVPALRLNDFDVEFTITSASSLLISPEATWKMMGPISISYTPKSGLEIVP